MGKIFAHNTLEKGLISKIYNELKCQKDKKSNQKIGKRPEQTLVQGIIGKYVFLYSLFPFHFADVGFSHAEAF